MISVKEVLDVQFGEPDGRFGVPTHKSGDLLYTFTVPFFVLGDEY
jgi:hypothetical protein